MAVAGVEGAVQSRQPVAPASSLPGGQAVRRHLGSATHRAGLANGSRTALVLPGPRSHALGRALQHTVPKPRRMTQGQHRAGAARAGAQVPTGPPSEEPPVGRPLIPTVSPPSLTSSHPAEYLAPCRSPTFSLTPSLPLPTPRISPRSELSMLEMATAGLASTRGCQRLTLQPPPLRGQRQPFGVSAAPTQILQRLESLRHQSAVTGSQRGFREP